MTIRIQKACCAPILQLHGVSGTLTCNSFTTIKRITASPDEATAPDEYKQNREIAFHDFMFSSHRHKNILLERVEFTVRNWLRRYCFMNISADSVLDVAYDYLQNN